MQLQDYWHHAYHFSVAPRVIHPMMAHPVEVTWHSKHYEIPPVVVLQGHSYYFPQHYDRMHVIDDSGRQHSHLPSMHCGRHWVMKYCQGRIVCQYSYFLLLYNDCFCFYYLGPSVATCPLIDHWVNSHPHLYLHVLIPFPNDYLLYSAHHLFPYVHPPLPQFPHQDGLYSNIQSNHI